MMLTILLAALAAASAAIAHTPQVDLDYAVYAGISDATSCLDVFKESVALCFMHCQLWKF
jgi:hypothetical protein